MTGSKHQRITSDSSSVCDKKKEADEEGWLPKKDRGSKAVDQWVSQGLVLVYLPWGGKDRTRYCQTGCVNTFAFWTVGDR